jgi:Ca2+-binding EF-hand superfamily protein
MRALGFEPKKEEIKKMISDIDKVSISFLMRSYLCFNIMAQHGISHRFYHL